MRTSGKATEDGRWVRVVETVKEKWQFGQMFCTTRSGGGVEFEPRC